MISLNYLIALAFVLLNLPCAFAQTSELVTANPDNILTTSGKIILRTPSDKLSSSKSVADRKSVRADGASSIRVHFKIPTAPTAEFTVEIADASDETKKYWSYTSGEKIEMEFWSDEIPRDRATVFFTAKQDTALRLEIDRLSKFDPTFKDQSLTRKKLKPITDAYFDQMSEVKAAGRAVARLGVPIDNGLKKWCTAFLVSSDLIMTNRHCIETGKEASQAKVQFDFDTDTVSPPELEIKEIVIASCDLDFILLRLKTPLTCQLADCTGPNDHRPIQLEASMSAITANEALIVIQHPKGRAKQVSLDGCTLTNIQMIGNSTSMTDFGHRCDTENSSSGSPVQLFLPGSNKVGKVIGIHHLGFRTDKVQANAQEEINRAVSMKMIVDYIRQNKLKVLEELGLN